MSSVWIRKLRHTFWGEWILACILYCLLLTELRNRLIRFFFIVSRHAFYIPNYHKHVTKYVRDLTLAWKLVIKLFYLLGNVPIRLYYEKTSCLVIHITYTLHVCQIRTFSTHIPAYTSITVQCSSKCYSEIVMQVFSTKEIPKDQLKEEVPHRTAFNIYEICTALQPLHRYLMLRVLFVWGVKKPINGHV